MAYRPDTVEAVDLEFNRAQGNHGKPTATKRNEPKLGEQTRPRVFCHDS
jgi:hypothetical protein